MATFDIELRDNGVGIFDISLSGGTPPPTTLEYWGFVII